MNVVSAALCRDDDHSAGGSAVLGFESARLDLNFLNLRKGDIAACIENAAQHVGHFLAIDDECILRAASSVDLELS